MTTDYIPDIDEQLPPPAYRLGTNNYEHRFESHHLRLPTRRDDLQLLINEQLNRALWSHLSAADLVTALATTAEDDIPYGAVDLRTSAGIETGHEIRYVVTADVMRVTLTFARYWRVDTVVLVDEGSSAYSECLIHFPVQRESKGGKLPPELVRFLGVVYIDDSQFRGEPLDPQALPIMLGREAFGLPKGPGQIHYCVHRGNPRDPGDAILRVWDKEPSEDDFLRPKPAILLNHETETIPGDHVCPSPPEKEAALPEESRASDYSVLASELGFEEAEFGRRLRDAEDFGDHAKFLRLRSDDEVLVWEDLYLYTRLVGLKQFPDPTAVFAKATDPRYACYQAIVESSLEQPLEDKNNWFDMSTQQLVYFPTVDRVQLIDRFAVVEDPPSGTTPRVTVPQSQGTYVWGRLVFGNPERTNVWDPA